MPHATLFRLQMFLWSTLLLTFMAVPAMHAQSDAGAGALRGAVNSSDGKAAVSAAVIVRNAETGYAREMQTDSAGRFDAQALPVGLYFVQATAGDQKSAEIEAVVAAADEVDVLRELHV